MVMVRGGSNLQPLNSNALPPNSRHKHAAEHLRRMGRADNIKPQLARGVARQEHRAHGQALEGCVYACGLVRALVLERLVPFWIVHHQQFDRDATLPQRGSGDRVRRALHRETVDVEHLIAHAQAAIAGRGTIGHDGWSRVRMGGEEVW